jgi:predicted aldo/keto reductase-like oxidoreductase
MDKKDIQKGRRDFIKKGLAGIAGLLALPSCVKKLEVLPGKIEEEARIIYRTLGRTKLRIPVVSFGVMNSHSEPLIERAIEVGVKHLDTAHTYLDGNSEIAIGNVLKRTGMRDNVYISTKMYFARDEESCVFLTEGSGRGPLATEENFDKQLALSLERLQTDYVDILYLHSCYGTEMVSFKPMMKALLKSKENGKARFLGVTTHRNVPDVTRAAVDAGIYDVVLATYNYMDNNKDEKREAFKYAAKNGVGIIAMKTMGGSRLNRDESVYINHKAALKWVLSDENVTTTIPGMTTFDQLELNMSVTKDLRLTEEEKRDLKLSSLIKDTLYCQNCRSCISTCPQKVEIPDLMRAFMYAVGYENYYQAKSTLSMLPSKRGIQACRECNHCEAMCANSIKIPERITWLIDKGFSGIVTV